MSLYQMALSQVGYTPHEAELSISHGHHGSLAKDQGLIALLRLGDLGHDCTNDESINDAAHNALQNHSQHSGWTLFCHVAKAIPNGSLGLQGEEEGSHETGDLREAGLGGFLEVRCEIPMQCSNEPEDEGKEKPGKHKRETEDDQHPAPADVHTSGEEVSEVPLALLAHIDKPHIAVAILLDKTTALLARTRPTISAANGGFH